MLSFLKRLRLSIRRSAASEERRLVERFDALGPVERDEVCEQLDRLWAWFLHAFDGLAGFLRQAPVAQDDFLDKLALAAETSRPEDRPERAAYYYSAAMLLMYLRGIRAGSKTGDVLALAARVAWGIDRGHRLRKG